MISRREIQETNRMIAEMNLDVRTITMGISLFDCIDSDITVLCDNIYQKITTLAKDLVKIGDEIAISDIEPHKPEWNDAWELKESYQ